MKNTYIGSPQERREDHRFLRGEGEYVDDIPMESVLSAVILRSSVAHGRIISINAQRALNVPGVHAVITSESIPAPIPQIPNRIFALAQFDPYLQPVIAQGKVRYVGEPIAVVLADSIAIGEDAIELIDVEIEELPAVASWTASERGETLLFESTPSNRPITFRASKGDANDAFSRAAYIRREHFSTGRHYSHTMEPRGVLSVWDESSGRLTSYGAAKVPFVNRRILSKLIDVPLEQIDLIENDVGGGYGARGEFYPEDFLVPFAARYAKRPVKWIEDRRENLMATNHARQQEAFIELACDKDGTMIGLRGSVHTDMGAYMRTNGPVCPKNTCQMLAGPYRIPHVDVESHLWMTNKTPIGTYRGPGRFEPCFYMERMVDIVAEDLGLDRIEFRRKNLIRADEQPYQIVTVQPSNISDEYDSGDYRSTLERALQEIDWPRVSALQGREIDGKLHGVGISCFLEGGAAGPKETARLEVDQNGKIAVSVGSSSVGQGVETVFAQIAADALGLPLESISGVSHGSTTVVSDGYGSFHCRSTVMAGSALVDASEKFLETLRAVVVKRNGAEVDKIELDGESVAAGGQRLPLKEFAGIRVEGEFINKKHTYSFGTQAAHITVDPKTGKIDIIDYVVVEDIGRVVNPLTVSGQVIGALVQGLGGSVLEELKYDENGQLLTGSLADYLLPTATDFPNLRCVVLGEYPSPINPLGVKGVGEGGIIGSGGCIANAVGNALHKIAEQPRSLPLTSGAIWKLVQAGRSGAVAA